MFTLKEIHQWQSVIMKKRIFRALEIFGMIRFKIELSAERVLKVLT